ncbi:hypothetical protein NOR_01627 [Metarhizium rileyi]|uniref:Uncharacterized protein n=1 Tax=Metarhizium rileyi (strain RCEF 4871) TaxID=1649241 RepID=A0A167HVM0_METRR|nr:hypothetical protein NOR_01627 [Metarhizium rileyi RCEF 4871]
MEEHHVENTKISFRLYNDGNYDTRMQALVIGLSVYIVSQDDNVSHSRAPLQASRSKSLFSNFHGVIFFNGTRLDRVPPDFGRNIVRVKRVGQSGAVYRD